MASFNWPPLPAGGGGGGITSINGSTTAAQIIQGGQGTSVVSSGGSTSITNTAITSFFYQPGGANGPNQYNTWSTLYSDLVKTSGARVVLVSSSITNPAIIPAGTYQMAGVTISGVTANSETNLQLDDGCVLNNLAGITNSINVTSQSNSAVTTVTNPLFVFTIDKLASLTVAGTGPFFAAAGGGEFIIILLTGGSLNDGNCIKATNSTQIILYGEEASSVGDNVFTDDGSGLLTIIYAANSATLSQVQPGFTGALSTLSLCLCVNDVFSSHSGLLATNPQDGIDEVHELTSSYDRVEMTTGGNHTIADSVGCCRLHATGTIVAYTLKMPANPEDSQFMFISANQVVTTFTLQPNTSQAIVGTLPTTLALGQAIRYQWVATDNLWYVS